MSMSSGNLIPSSNEQVPNGGASLNGATAEVVASQEISEAKVVPLQLGTVTLEELANVTGIEQMVAKQCMDVASSTADSGSVPATKQENGDSVAPVPVCAMDNQALLQQAMAEPVTVAGAFLMKTDTDFPGVDQSGEPNGTADVFTAVPELDESVSFQVGIPGAESSEEKAKLMGEDIRTCEFCQRTGPARTFYSATKRFCTVGCCHRFSASHQRPRRVAMRSMREANTPRQRKESRKVRERDRGSELYRSNESFSDSYPVYGLDEWSAEQLASSTVACLDSIGVSLLPTFNATTSSLAAGAKFSWATYLEETGALAAPDYCFPERHFPERNLFEGGMKVELACNLTQSPCDAYLATVTQVAGMRIQLTYDGADSSKPNSSVWRCIDALDIFPLGWCGSQGGQIVPPPGERTAAAQEWDDFLDKCLKHAIGAPDTYFPLKMTPTVPEFAPGHKVEISLDEDGAKRYCVATVAEVLADAVLVHLDGYEDDSSYYHTLPRDSTNLHPVGFCDERSLKLNPPKGVTDEVFDWSSYLTFTGSVAAPRELFRSTNNLFLQGMKLEAVDGRNPNMVCVAGIVDVIEDEIKIHFDGWADKFDFVVKKTDGNIFPVGWCAKFGHILTPPPALRGMNRPSETSSVSTPSQLAAAAAVGSFGGKRRRSSVPGLTPPSGKRKSISTAKGSPAPPRAIFNLSCNPGPYLDPQKVRVMTQEVAGSSVSIVLKSVLQFTIDAAYDQKAVFDMVRAGNSTVTVHCITQSGERLVKHLQVVDRNNILWSNLKNFFKNLQCCKRFLTQKHLAGQCERCTLHGGAGQYDAASVGGTPIEQQYTDGSWLGGNGQGKQEVEYLSPMSQSFNPSRPVVLNTNGGSAVLNAHANMRPDAGLFNDPKIEHLASKHPKSWSVDEVRLFFECTETEEHVATLVEQEIDGNAMCLLTPDSLVRYMGLRLGPSLKICGRVDGLKSKWNIH